MCNIFLAILLFLSVFPQCISTRNITYQLFSFRPLMSTDISQFTKTEDGGVWHYLPLNFHHTDSYWNTVVDQWRWVTWIAVPYADWNQTIVNNKFQSLQLRHENNELNAIQLVVIVRKKSMFLWYTWKKDVNLIRHLILHIR